MRPTTVLLALLGASRTFVSAVPPPPEVLEFALHADLHNSTHTHRATRKVTPADRERWQWIVLDAGKLAVAWWKLQAIPNYRNSRLEGEMEELHQILLRNGREDVDVKTYDANMKRVYAMIIILEKEVDEELLRFEESEGAPKGRVAMASGGGGGGGMGGMVKHG